jgi:general secretion pathway protein D
VHMLDVLALRYMLLVFCVILSACAAGTDGANLLEDKLDRKLASESKQAKLQKYIANNDEQQSAGYLQPGNDQLVATGAIEELVLEQGDGSDTVQLNLLDVPVAVAAKSVLGDIIGLNYSIDPRVQGTLTVQTSQPTSVVNVLRMFEGALRGIGAGIVGVDEFYRIVPLEEAARTAVPVKTPNDKFETIGRHPEVIPLKYVSAEDIADVINPLVPPGMIAKVDGRRNAIILSGSSGEIDAIRETIATFDVDWMRGMSFGLVPVKSSDPASLVNDLEHIYDTKNGPLRGVVKFVPNRRLKSVLIITSRSKYLGEARTWINKLDKLAATNEQQLHVYKVQNRTAAELAKVLGSVLSSENRAGDKVASEASNEPLTQSEGQNVDAAQTVSGPETPASGLGSDAAGIVETEASDSGVAASVRVVADDANNSLLIFATANEYQRILRVLQEVDSQPNQVLLEAVIAEVSLDDDLKFGVRWLFGEKNEKGGFTDLSSGLVASSFPGFSYFLRANDVSFTLNALASVTDVRVLSSPSLVVLDNKTATLQVGDQVPIVTQSAQGTSASGAPIVNNVDLKDTGVILSVTPRVNDSGRVILDIAQEVSSVVKTTTSGIDSPTIRQRKIKTSVVVTDGEALALGGLIQEKETTGKSKVPVLGDVPLIGNAFRQKSNSVGRTELIIFIRPRVIRDMEEARRITREFRDELSVRSPRVRRAETNAGEELVRILN